MTSDGPGACTWRGTRAWGGTHIQGFRSQCPTSEVTTEREQRAPGQARGLWKPGSCVRHTLSAGAWRRSPTPCLSSLPGCLAKAVSPPGSTMIITRALFSQADPLCTGDSHLGWFCSSHHLARRPKGAESRLWDQTHNSRIFVSRPLFKRSFATWEKKKFCLLLESCKVTQDPSHL